MRRQILPTLIAIVILLAAGGSLGISFYKTCGGARMVAPRMRPRLGDKNLQSGSDREARRNSVRGVRADYDSEPRFSSDPRLIGPPSASTRVDVSQLVKHCEDLGVNCYHFLIWHRKTDWEDLQSFVRKAEKSAILKARDFTVWVYLVPPSESRKMRSEPFGLDYVAWMENVAKFSSEHPLVTAVCIDDFYWAAENRALYTRDYLQQMRRAADKSNPRLALVSVLYWNDVDPKNEAGVLKAASVIADFMDGILYPYMAESLGKGLSHRETSALAAEIKRVREVYPGVPVILDIYVSRHTSCPDLPDPHWVGGLIDLGLTNTDGVALYCMPKKNKDGSFAAFWSDAMQNPAGIFEAVKSRFQKGSLP